MNWGLISHPYHRGGVTSWMMDFFLHGLNTGKDVKFLVPSPVTEFISASGKIPITSILKGNSNLFTSPVDFRFELGSFQNRVSFYKKLIRKKLPIGSVLIPSDDEAVWTACAELAHLYVFLGVLHSDDEHYYKLAEKFEHVVSGFIAVSKRIKSGVRSKKPHEVIPCGIQISKDMEFPPKENRLVFVGRIEEKQKRVSDLPKIFSRVKEIAPDWRLLIIGNGIDLESLKKTFSELKLNDSVDFKEWLPKEKVLELLSSSKILIQTSNYEGMSVAVMEALASGCQILSSKVSGVEDLQEDERSKKILATYPIGDINEAMIGFSHLLTNSNESIFRLSNLIAQNYFSIESCWNKYEQFSENLNPVNTQAPVLKNNTLQSDLLALARLFKYKITH